MNNILSADTILEVNPDILIFNVALYTLLRLMQPVGIFNGILNWLFDVLIVEKSIGSRMISFVSFSISSGAAISICDGLTCI